jgi:hypothetical protein
MMFRVAWRSLMTRPVRAAVLAAGFGFGIAVMAELLGVGQVILEQAHARALGGGGDLIIYGPFGSVPSARFLLSSVLGAPDLARQVTTASPSRQARVFLMTPRGPIAVSADGGIPSLEKRLLDPEVSSVASWTDTSGDERWAHPDPGELVRAMDRFHAVPDVPARAASWAEWLYFNGRTRDGRTRLYLTFLVGARAETPGKRRAGVRLQLEREGRSSSYSAQGEVDEASMLAQAPDLDIAGNRVRLDGLTYRMTLAMPGLSGEIVLEARPGRSLPPASIRGVAGWVSGYVVPVLAGTMRGTLNVGPERLTIDEAAGYHDHNWGFWEGVSWKWGQVQEGDLSVLYGRVFPPADAADPDRIPGFLVAIAPGGPIGYATNLTIDETNDPVTLRPQRITVRGRSESIDLTLVFSVEALVVNRLQRGPLASAMDFLQLRGRYAVDGTAGGRRLAFQSPGSAETFRGREGP